MAGSVNENNNLGNLFDPYLYKLEQQAPKPYRIVCKDYIQNVPEHYGNVCHGPISREAGNALVTKGPEGSYLIRESQRQPGTYTLVFLLDGSVKNYRIYYNGTHFIDTKEYDTLEELVADGLITLYVESRGREHIEAMSAQPIYDDVNKIYSNPAAIESTLNTISSSIVDALDSHSHNNSSINQTSVFPGGDNLNLHPLLQADMSAASDMSAIAPKAHNFKVTTFKGPHWCQWCGNYMWGLVSQGVKCQDCGLNVHKLCSKKFEDRHDCVPTKKRIKQIFGCDLTVLCMAYSSNVPFVVTKCIDEVENRDLKAEGLYRISGFSDDIELLKENFERNGPDARVDWTFFADINSITGALKLYLRSLPVPVIDFNTYPQLIEAMKATDESLCVKAIKEIVQAMNPCHQATLQFIIKHLHEVSLEQKSNKMGADNLGTVFGPTLMRSPDAETFKSLMELPLQKSIVSILISNYNQIFIK
ncbi:beta-chimaerin-like [Symsagittifera roscoffensis]|uniref:beta-chimaerin-like n=1 Tax=Symsagittifera roscoffensis TaxID=84072 RepID=UPI00307CB957